MKKTETLVNYFDFEMSLDGLIEELEVLRNRHDNYSNLRFQIEYGYESSKDYILVGDREETEQETSNRKAQEEKSLEAHKERVRKEAEKLGLL